MSKHTPGPWKIRTLDGSLGTIETADSNLQVAQAQQLYFNDRENKHAERLANTALIAAAPELLAALHKIVNNWDNLHPKDRQQARAAIAKATAGG